MAHLLPISAIVCDWQHPRKIGHNTKAWHDRDHNFSIRYHSTNVVSYNHADQALFVNTNGYLTKTTLERIRHGLFQLGLRLSTNDLKGKWRVMDNCGNAFTIRGNSIKLQRVNGEWQRIS